MKIVTNVTTDVDLVELYKLCKPISRKECAKAIRAEVVFLVEMRATDSSGSWALPDPEMLAFHLIERGLAVRIETDTQ